MSHSKPSSLVMNYALLFGIGFIWGFQYFLTKLSLQSFSIWVIAAGRIFIGATTLTLLLAVKRKNSLHLRSHHSFWKYLPDFILIGFFEATLPWTLISSAQQHLPSTFTAILIGTVPLFATFLEVFFMPDHNITREKTIAIVVGLLGVLILVGPKLLGPNIIDSFSLSLPFLPLLAMLIAAISFSISVLLIKIRLSPHLSPIETAQGMLIGALVTTLPLFFWLTKPWTIHWLHYTPSSLFALLVLGAVCSGVIYIAYAKLIFRTGPSFASAANYFSLTVATIIGVIFKGEKLSFNMLGGFLLIFIAFWLLGERHHYGFSYKSNEPLS